MAEKQTIWSRLKEGKLPEMDVNTSVGFDNTSLLNLSAVVFLSGLLIILAYFALKKHL